MQITRKLSFIIIRGLFFSIPLALLYGCGFVDSAGTGVNDPPAASLPNLTVFEQETVKLDSSGIVSDDFGNVVAYQWTQTGGETVVLEGTDQPSATFTAPTVLQYEIEKVLIFQLTVTDNFGATGTSELRVSVLPINAPPRANEDLGITVDEGTSVRINVVANDSDSDGTINSSTVTIITDPVNGSVSQDSNDIIIYTHDGSETTADSFTYTVQDNEGEASNMATVGITITPVDDDNADGSGNGGNGNGGNGNSGDDNGGGGNGGDDNGEDDNGGDDNGEDDNGEDDNGEDDNGEDGNGEDGNGEDGNGEDGNGEDGNGEDGNGGGGDDDDDDFEDFFDFTANITDSSSTGGNCWVTDQEQVLPATLGSVHASSPVTYSIIRQGTKGTVNFVDPTTGSFEYIPHPMGARGVDTFVYQVDDPLNGISQKMATVIVTPKLMPLGDGITAGMMDGWQQLPEEGQRVGYRAPLAERLTLAGYRFDFKGSQRFGADVSGFDADAEAHVNWSALELAYGRSGDGSDGIFAWLQANPSDIVLLHIGSQGLSPSDVESIFDEVDRWEISAQGNPVTVIVAQIIDQAPVNPEVSLFNNSLEVLVRNRVENPDHPAYPDRIVMVDQQAALSYPEDLHDSQYPNTVGYAKMSEVWFDALTSGQSSLLPKCP